MENVSQAKKLSQDRISGPYNESRLIFDETFLKIFTETSHDQIQNETLLFANGTNEESLTGTSLGLEASLSLVIFGIGVPFNFAALVRQVRNLRCDSLTKQQRLLQKLGLQLSLTNLIILVFGCLWRGLWLNAFVWPWGNFMCKVYSFGISLGQQLWSNMVAAISIDLFLCVKIPIIAYQNSSRRGNILISAVWCSAVLLTAPSIVVRGTIPLPTSSAEQCYFLYRGYSRFSKAYEVFTLSRFFYVPLAIICICQCLITVINMRNRRHRQNLLQNPKRITATITRPSRTILLLQVRSIARNIFLKSKLGSQTGNTADSLTQIERKMARKVVPRSLTFTSCAIVITYLLTWIPFQVFTLWSLFCYHERSRCADDSIIAKWEWLEVLTFTCTVTNPVLFSFLHQKKQRAPGFYSEKSTLPVKSSNNASKSDTRFQIQSSSSDSLASLTRFNKRYAVGKRSGLVPAKENTRNKSLRSRLFTSTLQRRSNDTSICDQTNSTAPSCYDAICAEAKEHMADGQSGKAEHSATTVHSTTTVHSARNKAHTCEGQSCTKIDCTLASASNTKCNETRNGRASLASESSGSSIRSIKSMHVVEINNSDRNIEVIKIDKTLKESSNALSEINDLQPSQSRNSQKRHCIREHSENMDSGVQIIVWIENGGVKNGLASCKGSTN